MSRPNLNFPDQIGIHQSECSISNRQKGPEIAYTTTDDVLTFVEFCKQQQPSITAREIQKKLVHNHVCFTENCTSKASYKRLNVVVRESLTQDTEKRLVQYLEMCSTLDSTSMHFFLECSVVKTTGNCTYMVTHRLDHQRLKFSNTL